MRKRPLRRGFTLRELFAVVTLICVLLALLVPLIQASRGRARRFQCHYNLKNISLGLLNYHDTYKVFPMGAMHAGPHPGGEPPHHAALGPSWWFGIAPFMEQRKSEPEAGAGSPAAAGLQRQPRDQQSAAVAARRRPAGRLRGRLGTVHYGDDRPGGAPAVSHSKRRPAGGTALSDPEESGDDGMPSSPA